MSTTSLPGPPAGVPGPPTGPEPGPQPGPLSGPPAARRRGAGTVADMLRSLLVCGGLVAVVVLMFFTSSAGSSRPPADVAAATAQARAAGLDVRTPHVPSGWAATSARYAPDTTEGLPTWHAGYLTPAGTDASVDVTTGATPAWLGGVVGDDGSQTSRGRSRVVDGVAWRSETVSAGDGQVRALVRTEGERTVVVSGHASWAQLETLARRS